jgi:hypothetical protein
MHYDQRWLDLAPTLFDDVRIVRDAGCNVAHWNLPERDLGAAPRSFFHFSGFDPDQPHVVTKYSRRLAMADAGAGAAGLFGRYARLLESEDYAATKSLPYAFGSFENGVPIPEIARRLYRELETDAADRFGDPFHTGRRSFFRWLVEPDCWWWRSRGRVARLWEAVYLSRADLQQAFPDIKGKDRAAFEKWIVSSGLQEHDVAPAFAPRSF